MKTHGAQGVDPAFSNCPKGTCYYASECSRQGGCVFASTEWLYAEVKQLQRRVAMLLMELGYVEDPRFLTVGEAIRITMGRGSNEFKDPQVRELTEDEVQRALKSYLAK